MDSTNKQQKEKLLDLFKRRPIVTSLLLSIIVITFGLMFFGGGSSSAPATSSISIGEKGHLKDQSLVATTNEAMDELMKALGSNDTYGVQELISHGRVFLAQANTSVLVIDTSFTLRKVRILEGEYVNKSGWVPVELVGR